MNTTDTTGKDFFYFDHNATTPVRPEVLEAMLPYLSMHYGNASSLHRMGRDAKKALDASRATIAELIGAEPKEIVFTGSGTEADNMALAGVVRNTVNDRNGLITSTVEHAAILSTADRLEKAGYPVTRIDVDRECVVDLGALERAVNGHTALVSLMYANNETGVVQDIAAAAETAHGAGALFHTDAVQAAGKLPLDVRKMNIDLLSMSAHKLNAPKGLGVLYVRKGVRLQPLLFGGGHERGRRPGTENIAGAVAMAKALELAIAERESSSKHLTRLRDKLETGVRERLKDIHFNGKKAPRLPGTSNFSVSGINGEALLMNLDRFGIGVSSGSACTAEDLKPSHVLLAMGRDAFLAQSSLRFSLGWGSTDEGIDHVLDVLPDVVGRLREISCVS